MIEPGGVMIESAKFSDVSRLMWLVVVLMVMGCEGGPLDPEVPVASVVVAPPPREVTVGDTLRLAAQARAATGTTLHGRVFTWSSNRTDVATVDSVGIVTGRAAGVARISAATGGRSGVVDVRVVAGPPAPVETVEVDPDEAGLIVGDTVTLSATARDANGDILLGRPVTWASNRDDVATVDGNGRVEAKGAGSAQVTATVGGVTATSVIQVASGAAPAITAIEPTSIQAGWSNFTMIVRGTGFVAGSRVYFNEIPLESLVVGPTEILGTVTASLVAVDGTAQITVRSGALASVISNAAEFIVFPRPASTVEILVPGNAVLVGHRMPLSAVARDQFGGVIPEARITWVSSDTTVARIAAGELIGVANGTVNVVASAFPTASTIRVRVLAAPASDLLFQAAGPGGPELFTRSLEPAGALRRLLPPGTVGRQAVASADGQRIAFVGRDANANEDVYLVNRDGSGLVRLTTHAALDDQPAWSPDGERIAFRSMRSGKSDIWVMQADGTGAVNLTAADGFIPEEYNDHPTWSPDGSLIAFSRGFGLGQGLFTVAPDGSGLSPLASVAGSDLLEPAWSPDAQLIAYQRRERGSGVRRIEFASATTGEVQYVVVGQVTAPMTPAWLGNDWIAVSAEPYPGSSVRSLSLLRLGSVDVVAPLPVGVGEAIEPAGITR